MDAERIFAQAVGATLLFVAAVIFVGLIISAAHEHLRRRKS